MRRIAFAAMFGLLLVALIAPVASAARPAPSFRAHSSAAAPGGSLKVIAKVVFAARGSTFSASATVHFGGTTGDVTVDLNRRGASFVAGAKVPVPADQPSAPVAVDVTITYNGTPYAVPTFWARIEAATP